MKEILKFWLTMGMIVGGIFAVVGGSMFLLSPFMGAKAVGLLWCGVMLMGIIIFASWSIYDDQRFERRRRVQRSLWTIQDYYSARF